MRSWQFKMVLILDKQFMIIYTYISFNNLSPLRFTALSAVLKNSIAVISLRRPIITFSALHRALCGYSKSAV